MKMSEPILTREQEHTIVHSPFSNINYFKILNYFITALKRVFASHDMCLLK